MLHLKNSAGKLHSYAGKLIGTGMCSIDDAVTCDLELSVTTQTTLFSILCVPVLYLL